MSNQMAFLKHGRSKVLLFGWSAALVLALAVPYAASAQVARFALVVGSNQGVEPQKKLRFAERDANRFAAILESLGGFQKSIWTELYFTPLF